MSVAVTSFSFFLPTTKARVSICLVPVPEKLFTAWDKNVFINLSGKKYLMVAWFYSLNLFSVEAIISIFRISEM